MPSGPVVWIDSGNCSWTGTATLNSSASPGVIIINNGTIAVGGTLTYYGLLYGINAQASSGTVISTIGNAQVFGAILVDGNGGVGAASSKLNIGFDPNAVAGINTVSNGGYIQTTWREL
jgi:hypothetical protein